MTSSKLISVGDIIDRSWRQYTKHIKLLLRISAVSLIVPTISILAIALGPGPTAAENLSSDSVTFLHILSYWIERLNVYFIGPLIGLLVFGALVIATNTLQKSKTVEVKPMLKEAFAHGWRLIAASILKIIIIVSPVLAVFPGTFLLLYNGTYLSSAALSILGVFLVGIGAAFALVYMVKFAVQYHFVEYEVLLNGRGPTEALKETKSRVKGQWWAVCGRIVLPKLLYVLAFAAVYLILSFLAFLIFSALAVTMEVPARIVLSDIVEQLISGGLAVISIPLITSADMWIYDSFRRS